MEIPDEDLNYTGTYDSSKQKYREDNPFKQKKKEKEEEWSPIPKRFHESYNQSNRVEIDYDNEI